MPNHLLEPDEDRIFAHCNHCGMEIYEGETYYEIDGDNVHEDCFYEYCREVYSDCKKEADCNG